MERIRALINKLQEQLEQKVDPSDMLGTVKVLQLELSMLCSSSQQKGSSKVAVVLPSLHNVSTFLQQPEQVKTVFQEPAVLENVADLNKPAELTKEEDKSGWLFDPVEEIPTFAHQKEFKELNEVIGQMGVSLNDKLKSEKTELASVLKEGPVRDLKKAIGINDRFVFLNELFRGDEAMYERSIKTINNFRIYAEAEYWIERELKVKIGWDEKKPAVKHFCQLVKRRFS